MILPRLPQRTYRTRIAVDLSARESRIWGGEFGWSEARRGAGGEGYLLRTMVPRGVRRHRHSGVWAAASHFATPRGAKGESGRRKANDVSEDDLSKRGRRVIVRPVPPSRPVNRAFGPRGWGGGGEGFFGYVPGRGDEASVRASRCRRSSRGWHATPLARPRGRASRAGTSRRPLAHSRSAPPPPPPPRESLARRRRIP